MLVRSELAERTADTLLPFVRRLERYPAATRLLRGEWLGHPVHPPLTDLPIGFWTSAWVLDFVPGGQRTARRLIGLGVLTAVPTAAAGVADWPRLAREKDATAVAHMGGMVSATMLYALSWRARRRGHGVRGFALAQLAAGVATGAAYFGGVLAFGEGEDRSVDISATGASAGELAAAAS